MFVISVMCNDYKIFTIQNVSIKSIFVILVVISVIYLQYKMFLLNFYYVNQVKLLFLYLQYKMFLLNLIFPKLLE